MYIFYCLESTSHGISQHKNNNNNNNNNNSVKSESAYMENEANSKGVHPFRHVPRSFTRVRVSFSLRLYHIDFDKILSPWFYWISPSPLHLSRAFLLQLEPLGLLSLSLSLSLSPSIDLLVSPVPSFTTSLSRTTVSGKHDLHPQVTTR